MTESREPTEREQFWLDHEAALAASLYLRATMRHGRYPGRHHVGGCGRPCDSASSGSSRTGGVSQFRSRTPRRTVVRPSAFRIGTSWDASIMGASGGSRGPG